MLLARGKFWRASLIRGSGCVGMDLLKSSLPDDLEEMRDLHIEAPLPKWNLLVKHAHGDRKLLGGLLLDFAKNKDRVSAAVANDRVFTELRRVIVDATVALVEAGVLVVAPADAGEG